MRAREYKILTDAVELGVDRGWMRAHKYADDPDEHAIKSAIYETVMGEICESFEFDDPVIE